MTIVERPSSTSKQTRHNSAAVVERLKALEANEALAVELSPDVKWVNFHSVVYKKCASEGLKLHYSRNGQTLTMWTSAK